MDAKTIDILQSLINKCEAETTRILKDHESYVDQERGLLTEYADGYTDALDRISSYCQTRLETHEDNE